MDCCKEISVRAFKAGMMLGSFYIQSKGLHSGRPLRKPIANCFVVYSSDEFLFSRVYCLWVLRKFEYYLRGSVIPFIRICDVIEALQTLNFEADLQKELKAVHDIDKLIETEMQKITLYKAIQRNLANKILNNVPTNVGTN